MTISNYGAGVAIVLNGTVTFSESLNDYPKLTTVEYTNSNSSSYTRSGFGMMFSMESTSVERCPIGNFLNQITTNYIHVSKKILEAPISTYDFVQENKNSAVKITKSSYYFSSGTLIDYAKKKCSQGSINAPGFLIELSKSPSPGDTITVKQYLDEYLQLKGLVYVFKGDSVSTQVLGSGTGISGNFISNYTITKNSVPTYKDTVLNWSKEDTYEEPEENPLVKKKYKQLDKQEYVVYEGDNYPYLPPGFDYTGTNSEMLPKDLSIMCDNAGVTKSCKITKYKWGQPEVEISAVFGFAECALELVEDPNKPFSPETNALLKALENKNVVDSDNAVQKVLKNIKDAKFGFPDDIGWAYDPTWRVISLKETIYKYEPLKFKIKPQLKLPDNTLMPVNIDPSTANFLNSNLEVLLGEQTRGWEIKRFAQESPEDWTKGSIAAWLNLKGILSLKDKLQGSSKQSKQLYNWQLYAAKVSLEQYIFRRIPIYENVDYLLMPYSKVYKDADEVDWQLEWVPEYLITGGKKPVSLDEEPPKEKLVPLLYPDPNWSPALMLVARSRYKSSFGISGNPDHNPFTRNYYGSNPVTITTGSEEYELVSHGVLPSKNTRPKLGDYYKYVSGNIDDIIEGINDLDFDFAPPFDHMNVGDYGIEDVPIPNISPSKVKAEYPTKDDKKNDQYTTLTSTRVAQDQSFKSYITSQSYSLADGRPPSATIRKPVYEEEKPDEKKDSPYSTENTITYITSNIANSTEIINSVTVSLAKNVEEALEGAKNQLIFNIVTSGSSASAQFTWDRGGQSLINGKCNLPEGSWVVKSATQVINCLEGVALPQPIQIEAGNLVTISLSSRTVRNTNTPDSDDEQPQVKVTVDCELPNNIGAIYDIPPDFSRWLK